MGRVILLPALAALSACAGNTPAERSAVFAADILKPAAERCAEAREIAVELGTREAAALAAVTCAAGP